MSFFCPSDRHRLRGCWIFAFISLPVNLVAAPGCPYICRWITMASITSLHEQVLRLITMLMSPLCCGLRHEHNRCVRLGTDACISYDLRAVLRSQVYMWPWQREIYSPIARRPPCMPDAPTSPNRRWCGCSLSSPPRTVPGAAPCMCIQDHDHVCRSLVGLSRLPTNRPEFSAQLRHCLAVLDNTSATGWMHYICQCS